MTIGRNDPCPCGSGKKYKRCCMARDEAAERAHDELGLPLPSAGGGRRSGVWQVDLAALGGRIRDDPAARPAVVLVVEDGVVLDADVTSAPPAEAEAVAAELEEAVARVARRTGGWPRRVEVREEEVARRLADALASREVEVVRRPHLDPLDALAADLRESLVGLDATLPPMSSPETWGGWRLPREVVAEIFRAAADFWRRRPWRWIASDDPLFAERGTSRPWTCCVLGNGGEEFGLALYGETEDFLQTLQGEAPFADPAGPILSLTFNRASELPRPMRREVAVARWEVASPDAYPVLIALNTPGGGVTRAVADDLIRLLRAVPEFVESHRDAVGSLAPLDEPVEWTSPGSGVTLRFEGAAPDAGALFDDTPWEAPERLAPGLPEGPGAEPEAALALFFAASEEVDALFEREMRVADRFAEALRAEGLSEATVGKHAINAAAFVEVLAFYQGVPVRAVTEYDLRSFLFDLYPRKYRDARGRVEAMPVSLTRFFRFLAEREGIVCPWAEPVLAERDAYAERLESFPGGFWWDEGVAEWRAALLADLVDRALAHWPLHADGTPWGPTLGPVEAELEREVQRRWLLWRDEVIRGGATDPQEVREALVRRQVGWETTPHPRLGRTPLVAIGAERRARPAPPALPL
jgi:hypothetical protein